MTFTQLELFDTPATDIEEMRQRLILEAQTRHIDHSQYRGYWNEWSVGRITADVQWRSYEGEQFRSAVKGEYVLYSTDTLSGPMAGFVTAHLPNSVTGSGLGTNTVIPAHYIEKVK